MDSDAPKSDFNPLPPHGGRHHYRGVIPISAQFQSTPSTRRETQGGKNMKNKNNIISIHSLHTEGDTAFLGRWNGAGHFNPLPPHGGRPGLYKTVRFQKSISIHSLHTEGDFLELMGGLTEEISIHSLHTEGDTSADAAAIAGRGFQSTPSTRRETPTHLQSVPRRKKFQSTPSTRRETLRSYRTCWKAGISIHSLHTEGDVDYTAREVAADISIHSLHTEGDAFCVLSTRPVFHISIHSLHTEGDRISAYQVHR